jgi:SAM-dependent methyltransferase
MFHHHVVNDCITFLNDPGRNRWYRDNLARLVPGCKVFEIGCGAGIMASYALQSGCQHYYGVDIKSDRARFTSAILDKMGYHGRHTVWCADAATMTEDDLPPDVDIIICEQTGHQMQSNFTIQQFWKNLYPKIPDAVSIPDTWRLDAHIYGGLLDSDLPEHQPRVLLDDPSLPLQYLQALETTDFVRPCEIVKDALVLTPRTAFKDLSFVLDLSIYPSATVVLLDVITFQDSQCPSSSALIDWPVPVKILIPKAQGQFLFRWDTQKRQPRFGRGFWIWEKLSD